MAWLCVLVAAWGVRIFQTVKIMRDQQKGFDEILEVIKRDELLEPS
jgi:hypothetical protein